MSTSFYLKAMKLPLFNPISLAVAMSLVVSIPMAQPSHAESKTDTRFFCGKTINAATGNAVPTTLASTRRGNVAMIFWKSTFFGQKGQGFSPSDRCQEVSRRFQAFYQDGVLSYLTTGKMNNQNVICVSDEYGGPCQGLLLTLEPKDNPEQVLQELLNVRARARGPLVRGSGPSYIDVQDFLDNAPVEKDVSSKAILTQPKAVKVTMPTQSAVKPQLSKP
jgi:Circadian oscillating protein COP23